MTPQEIIDAVRVLINDDNPLMPERFSDTELLGFVNQAVKRSCMVRPDLFIVSDTITPTPDQVEQEMDASVTRVMEIHRVTGGNAVGEVDKETMDRGYPSWTTEASGTPLNWMRHPRNPGRFYLYPAPATGTELEAEFIEVPADYLVGDTIGMPDSYKSALIDCVVYLAEVVDNEHVETQRAKEFYQLFLQSLGADMQQRALVDNEDGEVNEDPQQRSRRR